jgi:hypothetical protein
MRKTVYEWLDANRNGSGMAKKKSRLGKTASPPRVADSSNNSSSGTKKKRIAKKAIRKKKPR